MTIMATALAAVFENAFAYNHFLPVLNRFVLVPLFSNASQERARESALAHKRLDGLRGIEVGPSVDNPFGLKTINVGRRDKIYEREQLRTHRCFSHLHIDARADEIPLKSGSQDFVLSSHVIEHCPNLLKTLIEWHRILRIGGYMFMIVPHRDSAPSDCGRALTTWEHVLSDYRRRVTEDDEPEAGVFGHCHYHVFSPQSMKSIIENAFAESLALVDEQEVDDKLGNGFTLVYKKTPTSMASTIMVYGAGSV